MLQLTVLSRYTSFGGPDAVFFYENNTTEPLNIDHVAKALKTTDEGQLLTDSHQVSRYVLCAKCSRILGSESSYYCNVSLIHFSPDWFQIYINHVIWSWYDRVKVVESGFVSTAVSEVYATVASAT